MKVAPQPLVNDYLRALTDAARGLPRRDRDELVGEIRGHIEAALPEGATEADVRNVLDRLGPPSDIAAAADGGTPPVTRRGAREAFALVLLVSGFPPIVGWLIGLGLLLVSPLWSTRQKLLGALVWPGGLSALLFLGAVPMSSSGGSCISRADGTGPTVCQSASSGPPAWAVAVAALVLFAAPVAMAVHLWREAGRRSA